MPAIEVRALTKRFRVPVRGSGLAAALGSLLRRSYDVVEAIRDLSVTVDEGEMIGLLGPNGAGKTTTLKVLAGLLFPTGGEVSVLGHTPWQRRREYLRQISMVLGNKSQLTWDIPARDSFDAERNADGVTVLLTSHYMADVQALCRRVVLVDEGRLRFDGTLDDLSARVAPFKLLTVTTRTPPGAWPRLPATRVLRSTDQELVLRVERESVARVTGVLIERLSPTDLKVEDPPIEDVLDRVYGREERP